MHLTYNHNQVNNKINSFVTGYNELPLSISNTISFNLALSRQLKAKMKHISRKIIPQTKKSTQAMFDLIIDKFNYQTKTIHISHKTITELTRYKATKTSERAMKELHDLGLIIRHRRGKKETNIYCISWEMIELRPELLEDYGKRVNGHFVGQLNNSKELLSYNTKHDDNFKSESVKEEVKDDSGDEKPESHPDEIKPSKKNMALMLSLGITTFLKQSFYIEQWRLMMKVRKPNNGEEWNPKNANYLLEYIIRHEFNLKAKHKNKYIPPYTRFVFKNSQKPIESNPIQSYSTHSTFNPDIDYRKQWTPEEEKEHNEELQNYFKSLDLPPKETDKEEKDKRWIQ